MILAAFPRLGQAWALAWVFLVAWASPVAGAVPMTFTKLDDLPGEPNTDVTFQSHNQKVVSNGYGIFVTSGDAGGNVPMALWRSTNGGQSFTSVYQRNLYVNPPTIEAAKDGNIYLIYPETDNKRTCFQKFSSSNGFSSPILTKTYTQAYSSGKFATAYDPQRRVFYHATQGGYVYGINEAGAVTSVSKQVFQKGSNSKPSYPHLFVDDTDDIHYAMTTADLVDDGSPYQTIRYLKSTDGGWGNWKTMSGAGVGTPTTTDVGGPATMINYSNEVDHNTWLANMHEKGGKLHFAYKNRSNGAMRYLRFDEATGAREITTDSWSGGSWRINSVAAAFASDPDDHTSPLFAVGGNGEGSGDGNRLVALVSYDNGTTWSDHSRSGWYGRLSDPGTARAVTADGKVIGSVAADNPWATTNFFQFDTGYVYFDAGSSAGLQGGSGTAEGANFSESAGATIARVHRNQGGIVDSVLFKVNSNKTYTYQSGTSQSYAHWVVGNGNHVTHNVTAGGTTQTMGGDIIVQGGSSMQWNTANLSLGGSPSVIVKEGSTNRFTVNDGASDTYSLGRLELGSGNNRLETVDGAGDLNVAFTGLSGDAGDVISLGAGGSGKSTLAINNSSANTYGGVIAGTGNFTKSGAGTLTLTGNNTYSGVTTISDGQLTIRHSNALGTTAGNTVVEDGAVLRLENNINVAEPITFKGANNGYGNIRSAGNDTLSGPITLSGQRITNSGGSLTITGGINGSSGMLAWSMTVETNPIILSQQLNLVLGTTTLNVAGNSFPKVVANYNATLSLGPNGSLPDTVEVDLASVNGGTLDPNGKSQTIGRLVGSTRAIVTNSSATPATLTVGNGGGDSTFSGVIQDDTGELALTKTGGGTQTLAGANTFTGATTVNAGTLQLSSTYASPSHAIASGATLELNVASGSRDYAGTTFTGGGTLRKTGSGSAFWGQTATAFALDSGGLIDVREGTFTGGSWANENWVNNKSDLHVEDGAVFSGVEANIRVDTLTGDGTIHSGYPGAGYQHFTFGVDDGSGTFEGVLADGSAPGKFVKTGNGTQTLTGANTYTGPTTVNAGTLQVDGSIAASSMTTVAADGILSGNGSVGPLTLQGGTVAPGASVGSLSAANNVWTDGSSLLFEIDDATGTAGAAGGPGWDLLDIAGTLDLSGLGTSGFTINIDTLLPGGGTNPGEMTNFLSGNDYMWEFARTSDGLLGLFEEDDFRFDTSGVANPFTGTFGVSHVGDSLFVTYSAASAVVPEPSTLLLIGTGLLFLAFYGWRKRQ